MFVDNKYGKFRHGIRWYINQEIRYTRQENKYTKLITDFLLQGPTTLGSNQSQDLGILIFSSFFQLEIDRYNGC